MSVSSIGKDCYRIDVTVPETVTATAGKVSSVMSSINNYVPANTLPISVLHDMYHVSKQFNLMFYVSKWYSDYRVMVFNGGSDDVIISQNTILHVLCA